MISATASGNLEASVRTGTFCVYKPPRGDLHSVESLAATDTLEWRRLGAAFVRRAITQSAAVAAPL
jgi:hypothetical protein